MLISILKFRLAVLQPRKYYNQWAHHKSPNGIAGRCLGERQWSQELCSVHKSHLFTTHVTKVFFNTSRPRNALPPILLILLRPFAKFLAVAFGRGIRVWWKSLPELKKRSFIASIHQRKFVYLGLLSSIPLGAMYFYISHIDENPITKRRRFIAFSQEYMLQLADLEQETILKEFKEDVLPPSNPSHARVVMVVKRLLMSNKDIDGISDYKWRICVVDRPDVPNAFVLPNGSIFMFTGMLSLCANDDQLGVVLAHEISHTILRHTAEQVSNVHLIEFLLFFPIVVIWALLPDLGAVVAQYLSGVIAKMLLHLPFSRQTEVEADEIGLKLAAKACFDVREATCFWKKVKALISEGVECEWLSTHPSSDTRTVLLDSLTPSALKLRDSCQCPLLSSTDPRYVVDTLIAKMLEEKRGFKVQLKEQK